MSVFIKVIVAAFFAGLAPYLLVLTFTGFNPCKESFLLSPCPWVLSGLLLQGVQILWLAGLIGMYIYLRKIKVLYALPIIILGAVTFILISIALSKSLYTTYAMLTLIENATILVIYPIIFGGCYLIFKRLSIRLTGERLITRAFIIWGIVLLISIGLFPGGQHLWSKYKDANESSQARSQLENLPLVNDPKVFLDEFEPTGQTPINLGKERFLINSPYYPNKLLKEAYPFYEEKPASNNLLCITTKSLRADTTNKVFWVVFSSCSTNNLPKYFGPYRYSGNIEIVGSFADD